MPSPVNGFVTAADQKPLGLHPSLIYASPINSNTPLSVRFMGKKVEVFVPNSDRSGIPNSALKGS
jgi:hypothetical protein